MTRRAPSVAAVVNQPIRTRDKASTSAPAVQPTSPPSPRVHFSNTSSIITSVSRPLTSPEAWLLYDFETHCRRCPSCICPYARWISGQSLCHTGHHIFTDIGKTMYMHNSLVYERCHPRSSRKPMRVEIPYTYTYLREQFLVMEESSNLRRDRAEEQPRVRVHQDAASSRRRETPRRSSSAAVVIEAATTATGSNDRRDRYRQQQQTQHDESSRDKRQDKSYREHRSDYRHEEKKERERRRAQELEAKIYARQQRYRAQERRPTWVVDDDGDDDDDEARGPR